VNELNIFISELRVVLDLVPKKYQRLYVIHRISPPAGLHEEGTKYERFTLLLMLNEVQQADRASDFKVLAQNHAHD
jgi:hypothetical protein